MTTPSPPPSGPWRRLWPYLSRYRRSFALGAFSIVTGTAIQVSSPWVLKRAVDDLARGVTRGKLLYVRRAAARHRLVGGVFRFLMRRILIGASRDIEYDMRNDFFAHLEKLPLAYFQAHRTGDLMSRATNDLNAVRMMIGPSVMYSANTLLTFIVALGLMLSIDARLTLLALIPLPFVSISVKVLRQRDPQAVRADSGAAVRNERRRAGGAVGRPRRAGVPAGSGRDRAVPRAPTRSTCAATAG